MGNERRHAGFGRVVMVGVALVALAAPAAAQHLRAGTIAPTGSRIGPFGARRMAFPQTFRHGTRFQSPRFARPPVATPFRGSHGAISRSGGHEGYGRHGDRHHLPQHGHFEHHASGLHISASDGDLSFKAHIGGGHLKPGHFPKDAHYKDVFHHLHRKKVFVRHPIVFAGHVPAHHFAPISYRVPHAIDPYLVPSYVPPTINIVQQQQQPAPPPEPTAMEMGRVLLEAGVFGRAVEAFRDAVKEDPDDATAMRLLGVALIGDGRVKEGVAMISFAYATDPSLAETPLAASGAARDRSQLREWVRTLVENANRTHTSDAWLAVAVMMQAESRERLAQQMARRALEEGLDTRVYDAMNRALTR